MKTLFISALALSAAGPLFAREVNEPSPAEAACDEQLGEFRRDGAKVYCEVDGVVYERREELQTRADRLRPFGGRREQRAERRKSNSRGGQQSEGLNLPQK